MPTSRPVALITGASTGATVGRLLGIGTLGSVLGLAAGLFVAYLLVTPTADGGIQ